MTPDPSRAEVTFAEATSAAGALAALPPFVAEWFTRAFRAPTEVQRLAWPPLAAGRHALVSAPTGTGKTLAAFLPALVRLLEPDAGSSWSDSPLRCLYVAPLKALGNDACRNLEAHLADLAAFCPPGTRPPRLAVRTGDTPAAERRRLRDDPPDVLLTTPESLALLLSQGPLGRVFANLRTVVVDEVHALAPTKRGADLALSLERLTALAGEGLQRVGLSATATPLAEAARYLVGAGRPCVVAHAGQVAPPVLTIEPLPEGESFLNALVQRLAPELPAQRATLVFANSRGLTERLAWALRRHLPEWDALIAVHHSALAAGRRREVEEAFKHGRLRVVVTSTSLELGIDVGAVDLAVLVHPPGDVVRLLQRVGRAGHGPGGVRRGLVLTATAAELLEATVTAASGLADQCEPLRLPEAPLDVLCQQLLGMAAAGPWEADAAFALARRAAPFASLTRADFDDCVRYLRGLDRHGAPWLPPRLREDGDCWRVSDARTARLLRANLGTILDPESVPVRLRAEAAPDADDPFPAETAAAGAEVGEVEEAFAERLQPGDRFLLDGRCLEFRARHDGALLVDQVPGRPQVPRWGGDGWPLSRELARRLYVLRVQAAEALREGPGALAELLRGDYGLGPEAAALLGDLFQRQECVSEVPDTQTLLVEGVATDWEVRYFVHTPLNRPGNDALARVAVARLARDHGRAADSLVADLGFALILRGPRGLEEFPELLRSLLAAGGFDADLDAALAGSAALRQRFERVAQTGLMLLRRPLGRRRVVGGGAWGERVLFEQVRAHDPDFVLLRQAAREVRAELCDAEAGRRFATELPGLALRLRWPGGLSPFAAAWTQPAEGAAGAVETPAEALRRLHAALTEGGDARPG